MIAKHIYKKTTVRCSKCQIEFDTQKVKFLNIEEDITGQDILTYECPICKVETKSYVRG